MLEEKLIQTAGHLFKEADKVLLAVSGGADSVAMAHAMVKLKEQGQLPCEFVIAHINHCLRGGQSDADEAFVKALAQSLNIPVVTQSVNVTTYAKKHKLSIETAGRALRLKALASIAQDQGCTRIATAHHADDQAETLIHRLMRGTGFRGLSGIKPFSMINTSIYIRPMLNIRRAEILQYCNDNHIQWRQDKSNTDLKFTRNRIRHELLPALGADADLGDSLVKLADVAQHLQKRVDAVVTDATNQVCLEMKEGICQVSYNRHKLNDCSPWTFYEIIRRGVITLGVGLRDYSKSHFEMIRHMAEQSKARADFPGRLEVVVEAETVTIRRQGYQASELKQDGRVAFWPGADEAVEFGSWNIKSRLFKADEADVDQFLKTKDASVEWFDADQVVGPLIVRPKEKGDRFRPIGARFAKKVARFLIDAQLDAKDKQNTFVITDAEKILWVAPIRMAEQVKVTQKTTQILEIRILRAR